MPPAKVNPGTDENVVQIDFRGLTPRGGGRAARGPEGDYLLQLVAAKNVQINGKPATQRQIAAQFRVIGSPDFKEAREVIGSTVYTNLQIMPDSKGLWFTRNVLEDLLEKDVTGKAVKLTLDEHINKLVGATLQDGKPFVPKNSETGEEVTNLEIKYSFPASRFVGYNPSAGGGAAPSQDEDDEEEEAPAPKAKSNGKAPAKAAAEAVAESSEDEEEIEIEELENI